MLFWGREGFVANGRIATGALVVDGWRSPSVGEYQERRVATNINGRTSTDAKIANQPMQQQETRELAFGAALLVFFSCGAHEKERGGGKKKKKGQGDERALARRVGSSKRDEKTKETQVAFAFCVRWAGRKNQGDK